MNCGPEAPIINRTYFVENNSNVPVELVFYERFTNELKGSKLLFEGERYKGESIEFHKPHSVYPENDYPSISFESDSIILIFQNEMKTSYVNAFSDSLFFSPPVNRNIFRQGNYEELGGYQFLYTITQEDYENATPCDEDCE